jgi:hypothetical protein
MPFNHLAPENIKRIAKNIYDWRMVMKHMWGTAEGDFAYAKQLCEKWNREQVNEK